MFRFFKKFTTSAISAVSAFAIAGATVSVGSSFCHAQSDLSKDEFKALREQLSSGGFADRQAAMHRLWGLGNPDDVQSAIQSDDPEVRLRATWIGEQWKLGIRPDTPANVARILRNGGDAADIGLENLIATGDLGALAESLLRSEVPSTRHRIAEQLRSELPQLMYQAMQRDQTEAFIDLMAGMSDVYIVALQRCRMMHHLGYSPEECVALPKATDNMKPEIRSDLRVMMYWSIGMKADAIRLAEESKSSLLAYLCLDAGDWQGLISAARQAADAVELPDETTFEDAQSAATFLIQSGRKVEALRLHLVGLYRDQQQDAFDLAISELTDLVTSDPYMRAIGFLQSQSSSYRTDLTWATVNAAIGLIAVDRPEIAVRVLKDLVPTRAVEILEAQARYDQAFEILGVDWRSLDSSLMEMAKRAAEDASKQEESDDDESSAASDVQQPLVDRCLEACDLAYQVGHQTTARQALKKIAASRTIDAPLRRLRVVEAALARADSDFAIEIAIPLLQMESSDEKTPQVLFRDSIGGELYRAIGKLYPKLSTRRRAEVLIDLSLLKLPEGWSRSVDLNRLASQLHDQTIFEAEQINPEDCTAIAKFFRGFAREDWAATFYQTAATYGSYDAWIELANSAFQQGDMASAADLYEGVWRRFPSHPETLARLAVASRLDGQDDHADQVEQRLNALTLEVNQYYDIALLYKELDRMDDARRFAEKVIRYTPGTSDRRYHYLSLILLPLLEDQVSPGQKAELALRRMNRLLGSTTLNSMAYYLGTAFDYHQNRARQALIDEEHDVAEQHFELALRHLPANIDFAEKDLVEVRKQGHAEQADRVADSIFQAADSHLRTFPLHANMANNAAWVAALHGRHLDRALELASSAVAGYPISYSYRDTLAEVLYRLGNVEQAIQVESNCLLDVPDDYHLHQQLKRFKQGLP
ncbi:MAG: hypothetical protein R3C05_21200 [Pirellulaceae bacterium]